MSFDFLDIFEREASRERSFFLDSSLVFGHLCSGGQSRVYFSISFSKFLDIFEDGAGQKRF